MKTIVHARYGSPDVLAFKEVEMPHVGDGDVLVKVQATAVNAYDWHILRADPFLARLSVGLFKPKKTMLGVDIAGRVEAVGKNVQQFRPGDDVFGDLSACGGGGYAEYVAVPETELALKPTNLSYVEAAAVPMAAVTALQGLRDLGKVRPGKKVLINGASGGVGTFAVQIARVLGAEITAVCSSSKMEMVRALGADQVIDYGREDFTQHKQRYDLILAVNGYLPIAVYKQLLAPQGVYIMAGGFNAQIFQAILLGPWLSLTGGKKLMNLSAKPKQTDLIFVKELLESGKIHPVMDRCYPFNEVQEAIRYLEKGHAKGKVVVTM